MLKAIFLDMDDTLIYNQVLFEKAEEKLYDYLKDFGIRREEAQPVFAATDKELFKTLGRTPKRLLTTFETVLRHFVPNADQEMVDIVKGFAGEVFTTVAPVMPGVPEAVALLAEHYPLYIVTAGDKTVQERRLSLLPFRDTITEAFVVDKKDQAVLENVLAKLGYKAEDVAIIGDSLVSDILPGVAAGLQAVWVEAHNSPFEQANGLPEKGAVQFSSLLAAARHITTYGTAFTPDAVAKTARPALRPKGPSAG